MYSVDELKNMNKQEFEKLKIIDLAEKELKKGTLTYYDYSNICSIMNKEVDRTVSENVSNFFKKNGFSVEMSGIGWKISKNENTNINNQFNSFKKAFENGR